MSEANWDKKKEIFVAALTVAPDNLAEFLDRQCVSDSQLRQELDTLLAAHFASKNFIEKPAFEIVSAFGDNGANKIGTHFGNYKIVSEIGRGGMGAVFLAKRSDGEFNQQVALKIIRQSFADAELERRFRSERQILASLNHPNIARLLDGGISETGELFLAMEYVAGEPLLEFAMRQNLNIEKRLQLFLKVCSAVQYAHRNLIVHRDLKPSNILVDADGEPKLLDFGLAKILDESVLDASQTATAFHAFTPAYASPEQIRGRNITTASDVYSLGVVFYELLTGMRPFQYENKSYEDILRSIDTLEPPKPSDAATQREKRGKEEKRKEREPETTGEVPNISTSQLTGDLDNIALMALRKEPERRYESVGQFAQDIERHLSHLPILARPQTAAYRAAKFFERNKIAVSAVALVILALSAGLAVALWQANVARAERDRAEKRFADVRQLSNALLTDIAPKIENVPGSTEARQALVNQSLKYLDSLANESQDDLQLQSELAAAYEKIGDLQGNPTKPNLSDFAGAILSYEKANNIRQKLSATVENQRLAAENFRQLSAVRYVQNDVQGSLQNLEEALKIYETLLANDGESFELQTALLDAQLERAQTYSNNNQHAEALPLLRKAVAAIERLDPNHRETQRLSAKAYSSLGNALSWSDQQTEAEREMAKAVTIAESLTAGYPNDANLRQGVWRVYILASSIYEDVNNETSLRFAQRALETVEKAVASDRADTQAKQNLAKTFSRIGIVSALLNRLPEAVSNLEKAEKNFLELIDKEPRNQIYKSDLGRLYTRFGDTKEKQGNLQGSLEAFRKSADFFEQVALADEKNTFARRDLAQSLKSVGVVYVKLGEGEKARQNLEKALEILNRLKAQNALGEYDRKLFDDAQTALQKLKN